MRIGVVGAGITGLVLARELAARGFETIVWEADDRVGGQVRTLDLWDRPVDVGAEAVHLAAPQVAALLDDLGLSGRAIPANPGASRVLTARGLRPLPAGVGPTGPTRIWPVLRSRTMTLPGILRAGLEPVIARRHPLGGEDVSVGAFIRGRFGDEVADLFVDPLLGNLHSGDVDRLSLQSTAPQLLAKARSGASLLPLRQQRRSGPTAAPGASSRHGFASLPDGLAELPLALASGLDVRLGAPVRALAASGRRWSVRLDEGEELVDALAVTTPAAAAGMLLDPLLPGIEAELARGRTADVATVVIAYPRDHGARLLDEANGLLLPSSAQHLTKAMTNLGRKWPHLQHPDVHLVRASVGRAGQVRLGVMDDHQVVQTVTRELHEIAGLPTCALGAHVVRWPAAMPQLEVGHRPRMAAIRAALAPLPPIVLAGAPFDGLGIGSTLRSAQAQAGMLIDALDHQEAA